MTDAKFEKRVESFGTWSGYDGLKEGFDLKTARDEWLDPDPRLRWASQSDSQATYCCSEGGGAVANKKEKSHV